MDNRTNYVKVDNLPDNLTGLELHEIFEPYGDLLEMTAISQNSLIVTYMRRSAAHACKEILHNQLTLQNQLVSVEYFYPATDPGYATSPLLQGLGTNIANDTFVYNHRSFIPWNGINPNRKRTSANAAQPTAAGGQTAAAMSAAQLAAAASQGAIPRRRSAKSSASTSNSAQPMSLRAAGGTRPTSGHHAAAPTVPIPANKSRKVVIGGQYSQILTQHTIPWHLPRPGTSVDDCAICLTELGDPANYDVHADSIRSLSLNLCNHTYHQSCLESLLKNSPSPFLQCPACKKVYGTMTGNRPLTGTISHSILNGPLPGNPSHNTIQITFRFTHGTQGPEHPHPGRQYSASNFPRMAYLPDSPEGLEALHGLYLAWEQRLLFTVGRSLTTSQDDVVTWNDIHLKTNMGQGEHGYPAPDHIKDLKQELKGFGITEATISSHMANNPNLRANGHM